MRKDSGRTFHNRSIFAARCLRRMLQLLSFLLKRHPSFTPHVPLHAMKSAIPKVTIEMRKAFRGGSIARDPLSPPICPHEHGRARSAVPIKGEVLLFGIALCGAPCKGPTMPKGRPKVSSR